MYNIELLAFGKLCGASNETEMKKITIKKFFVCLKMTRTFHISAHQYCCYTEATKSNGNIYVVYKLLRGVVCHL